MANKILYDIHDSQSRIEDNNYDKISKIMLKSNFHKTIISSQKKTTSETEDFITQSQSDEQSLDRIVVFYKDGRFENYTPKKKNKNTIISFVSLFCEVSTTFDCFIP